MDASRTPGLGSRHDASRVQKPQSAADRAAALKARVNAAVGTSRAKGGLNIGLHPALEDLNTWAPATTQDNVNGAKSLRQQGDVHNIKPRSQGTRSGNVVQNLEQGGRSNPYLDNSPGAQTTGGRPRESRQLIFNQKGKYIQQANALRRQEALEAMKKRIAASTRKAGIDEDRDIEKLFVVEKPPDAEWWDEGLLQDSNYIDIENPSKLKFTTPDSLVTEYVQHPVALEPPQDRHAPAPKAMFLTSKEQAKIRRQRRMAELKEMQAKIRLGLVPAPPPKVKKGNLMRVLGDGTVASPSPCTRRTSDLLLVAVKDPTAVEARVNREIAERHEKHVDTNHERSLTKEQQQDKLAKNQQKDAEKGIHILVFKVASLANGQHRYKIGVNAEQLALTGTCILHPKLNLVIVEGGIWSINKYKKLMLNRIDWTENSPSRTRDQESAPVRDWLQAEGQDGELKDMSQNVCTLIFEGEQKTRAFRKWGNRVCETDTEARESLARAKMENFWALAKSTFS